MSQCGSVGMDRYWNYVATPLFFIVIAFGMFALFTASDIQTIDTDSLKTVIAAFSSASGSTPGSTPASVADPNSSTAAWKGLGQRIPRGTP
jgi:hypothetical protein